MNRLANDRSLNRVNMCCPLWFETKFLDWKIKNVIYEGSKAPFLGMINATKSVNRKKSKLKIVSSIFSVLLNNVEIMSKNKKPLVPHEK